MFRWSPIILIIYVIFFIWALSDVLTGKFENGDKTAWVITVIFVPFLGIIFYFLIGREQRKGKL